MNSSVFLIIVWFVYAISRAFLFSRLQLKFWESLIPIYGTHRLFMEIWSKQMAILYIGAILVLGILLNSAFVGTTTSIILFVCLLILFVGWTGQAYYCALYLNESWIQGLLLALFFPIFSIALGRKKNQESDN